jgi:DNA-binding response OmpR family regulator
MTAENVRRLVLLSRQLDECLMSAALCAKELGAIAHAEADRHDGGNGQTRRPMSSENSVRPLMDESTLSVMWHDKTLHLGNTQGFWLLTRLLRCANRYVTHVDLLREIWDDEFADTGLLRAGIQRLRVKLRRGGMADLAGAITGHNGRYMLNLAIASRHAHVTAISHRTSQA